MPAEGADTAWIYPSRRAGNIDPSWCDSEVVALVRISTGQHIPHRLLLAARRCPIDLRGMVLLS